MKLDLFNMRVYTYNWVYFSELQCFFNSILFIFLVFFFLVFIPFNFIAFLATMTLKLRLVVSVVNIIEGSRDVV
jgi:accessory gene regulator protein AgrB